MPGLMLIAAALDRLLADDCVHTNGGSVRKGERFRSRVQVTQVWVRESRRWRRAAFHDSALETR